MSWKANTSRPSKHSAVPPPFYLTHPSSAIYCRTCGRITKTNAGTVSVSAGKSAKVQGSGKRGKLKQAVKSLAEVQAEGKENVQAENNNNSYCSTRCRHRKPGPIDHRIEEAFKRLLNGELPLALPLGDGVGVTTRSGWKLGVNKEAAEQALQNLTTKRRPKGDDRLVVNCSLVEELLFGPRKDPEKVFGRKKDRASRVLGGKDGEREWRSVDMESSDDSEDQEDKESEEGGLAAGTTTDTDSADTADEYGGGDITHIISLSTTTNTTPSSIPGPRIRPPQLQSDVNGGIGGEKGWAERKEETPDELAKRREGQRKAEEKEMVKRAARRCCVFGVATQYGKVEDEEVDRKKGPGRGNKKTVEEEENEQVGGRREKRRFCETVMGGSVVEPSFAKGDWAVRWRED